jgi:hypothetical protein
MPSFPSVSFRCYHQNIVYTPLQFVLHALRISSSSTWFDKSKSKSRYDWRSVSMSRCRALSGTSDQILKVAVLSVGGALSDKR